MKKNLTISIDVESQTERGVKIALQNALGRVTTEITKGTYLGGSKGELTDTTAENTQWHFEIKDRT